MSAAVNRQWRRRALRDVRALGCTCTPTFAVAAVEQRPAGVVGGGFIRHEVGCVLGDKVAVLNRLGVMPVIWHRGSGCAR